MNALIYLYRIRLKNKIKSIIKSPAQIILIVFFLALVALNIFAGSSESAPDSYRDISELYAGLEAVLAFIYVMISYGGISRGGSLFSMPDVNYIFVSPTKPVNTLFYGLVQQIGTALLMGYFILLQFSWMNRTYGIKFAGLLLILVGYALTLLCGQLTSMLIYSMTSSRSKNRQIARYGILTVCAIPIVYILAKAFAGKEGLLAGIVSAANEPAISLFPVAGWLKSAIVGLWTGELFPVIGGAGAVLAFIAVLFYLLSKSGDDYYEDVLRTTENKFKTVMASKSGEVAEAVPENIKLGKTGLKRGFGADALYYKQKLENRRASVFILDLQSIVFLGINVMFGFIMQGGGKLAVFAFTTYMMIFTVAMGRWLKELIKPFIYLIPEPPFKKLLHCLRESLMKLSVEAIILFAVLAFVLHFTVPEFILAVAARISFGLLFVSANIFIERFFGFVSVKLVAIFIFFISMIVFALPGIIITAVLVLLQISILPETLLVLASLSVCNLLISLAVIYISRNVLEYAELNSR